MKRRKLILCLLLCTLLASALPLSGCGETEEPEIVSKYEDVDPWLTYDPNFSTEETRAMSSQMNRGWYLIEDNTLYGLSHRETNAGALGVSPIYVDSSSYPGLEDTVTLDSAGYASYLHKDGDYLYYLRNYEAVCRVNLDGSAPEVLYEGECDYLLLHEGMLYFCDENAHLLSCQLDGSDVKTVIDKAVYYPYFICTDWLIFQDDADGEKLHLFNTTAGEDITLTENPSFHPILDGTMLYFTQEIGGENIFYVSRIDMSKTEPFVVEQGQNALDFTELAIDADDDILYGRNNTGTSLENWDALPNPDPENYSMQEIYSDETYSIHHEFDDNGVIYNKYLVNKATDCGAVFN